MINLFGPPAAGKSLYATRFCFEHPSFKHHSIDNYRRKYDEEDAWYNLMKDVVNTKQCILESSGLSWRLHAHILNHPAVKRRGILHLCLHANSKILHDRLTQRQNSKEKAKVPFKYANLDEHSLIDKCFELIPAKYKKGFIGLKTDAKKEEVYQEFSKIIIDRVS